MIKINEKGYGVIVLLTLNDWKIFEQSLLPLEDWRSDRRKFILSLNISTRHKHLFMRGLRDETKLVAYGWPSTCEEWKIQVLAGALDKYLLGVRQIGQGAIQELKQALSNT